MSYKYRLGVVVSKLTIQKDLANEDFLCDNNDCDGRMEAIDG